MNYLTTETLKKYFNQENLNLLVEDLRALRKQAITLIDADVYDALVNAVANEDYDATMSAILSSDDQEIMALDHFLDLDPSASGVEDSTNIDNLIELAEVHVLIIDHSCNAIEETTLIAVTHFSDHIREIEVGAGNIASHLEQEFPWGKYAETAAIDYEQVKVKAPNTLGLDSANFYIRK